MTSTTVVILCPSESLLFSTMCKMICNAIYISLLKTINDSESSIIGILISHLLEVVHMQCPQTARIHGVCSVTSALCIITIINNR